MRACYAMTSSALLASAMSGMEDSSRVCPRRRRDPKYDTSNEARTWANCVVKEPRTQWSELSKFSPEWRMATRPDLLGCVGRMHRTEDINPPIRERTVCNPINVAGSLAGGSAYPPLPRQYTSERLPYDMHCVESMPLDEWPDNLECRGVARPQTAVCPRVRPKQSICERPKCERPKTSVPRNRCPCPQHHGNCTRSKERVYVFVRFGKQYILPMRNSLTTNLSVLKNYHGRIIGIGECVETVDGYFPDGNAMVVLEFATLHDSHMWYNSCPEVRQHDWLHGVDMVVLPLRATAPTLNVWIQLSDISIRDCNVFYKEYMPGHTKLVNERGGILVAATDSVQKLRGGWDIQFGAIYQWLSKNDFYNWYQSAENAKWREMQQEVSSANIVIFKLAPLCKETSVRTCCSDDPPENACYK